jgi:hypothetical protein
MWKLILLAGLTMLPIIATKVHEEKLIEYFSNNITSTKLVFPTTIKIKNGLKEENLDITISFPYITFLLFTLIVGGASMILISKFLLPAVFPSDPD